MPEYLQTEDGFQWGGNRWRMRAITMEYETEHTSWQPEVSPQKALGLIAMNLNLVPLEYLAGTVGQMQAWRDRFKVSTDAETWCSWRVACENCQVRAHVTNDGMQYKCMDSDKVLLYCTPDGFAEYRGGDIAHILNAEQSRDLLKREKCRVSEFFQPGMEDLLAFPEFTLFKPSSQVL